MRRIFWLSKWRVVRYHGGFSLQQRLGWLPLYWPLCHTLTVEEAERRIAEHARDGEAA